MAQPKTHFEQVPLHEIQEITDSSKLLGRRQRLPNNLVIERPENKQEPYTRPAISGEPQP